MLGFSPQPKRNSFAALSCTLSTMLYRWTIGLLALCCLGTIASWELLIDHASAHAYELAVAESRVSSPATEEFRPSGSPKPAERIVPGKVYELLAKLRQRGGEPLPGYIGGREFQNRERRLPRGRYREYDVNRKVPGRSRDAERIVIEQTTGKAYYSGNHYRTFIPLN